MSFYYNTQETIDYQESKQHAVTLKTVYRNYTFLHYENTPFLTKYFFLFFSLLPQLSIAKMDPMSQVFCLRWNNHRNNLLTVFDQLLQTEAFCDVTLACDNNSIKCHKMILCACSSYFQQLFMENTCEHPIVFLKDIKYEEIRTILDYMYKGEVNVAQEELPGTL